MIEVNVTELAKIKGVSRKSVYAAVRDGRIQRNPNGNFDKDQALSDWTRNTNPFRGGNHSKQAEEEEPSFSHPLSDLFLAVIESAAPAVALKLKALGLEQKQNHQVVLWTSWIHIEVLSLYMPVLQDKSWIPMKGIFGILGDEGRFAQWLAACEEKMEGETYDDDGE